MPNPLHVFLECGQVAPRLLNARSETCHNNCQEILTDLRRIGLNLTSKLREFGPARLAGNPSF
jgi:hypothetical protein